MTLQQRITAFTKLGEALTLHNEELSKISNNQWFTPENIAFALDALAESLTEANLKSWLKTYPELSEPRETKNVGVIAAGNIPLVVFHDFLSVLISGHRFVGKLSSKDDKLLPAVISMLIDIEPAFNDYIYIKEDQLTGFDAVIATGSNNSARYFENYFGKYPHIIRKNRNSVALLTGNETKEDLEHLADDIFMYFGLGCRNVSKLFLPDDFDLNRIFENSLKYAEITNHHKYANNYDYNRAIYLMDSQNFYDNGFMLMKEHIGTASPISVVYFERYSNIETVMRRLEIEKDSIQCVVSTVNTVPDAVTFGDSQKPRLWDYADNVDTLKFLLGL